MYISSVSLVNYRNFKNTKLRFSPGVNTVIGENGTGKTNLFRAIRLLLDGTMLSAAYRLSDGDFHRGLASWKGHWIFISAEFSDITMDEAVQALFVHGAGNVEDSPVATATVNLIFRPRKDVRVRLAQLRHGDKAGMSAILNALTADDYETVFTGRSTADFTDHDWYKSTVGDFDNAIFNDETSFPELGSILPKQLAVSREVSFSYIQALRDVVQDFQYNRANPLRNLLRSKSGQIDSVAFKVITDKVTELNTTIENWADVQEVRDDIHQTLRDAVGETFSPTSLNIKSDLPDDADRLFQSLKLFVGEDGEDYEGGIHELSLGGANLIYLTLKLLEFKYQKAKHAVANFLLIEEPEAHIHTHIQRTLFDRLNYADTQIIYSTHSTQISEVSKVESMNILGRSGGVCQAYQPAAGLDASQVRRVQRYLDAVRSNLLFARSVLLVEGDAEEILVPILIKRLLGIEMDELGISLINIRSTGFENVAMLFHDDRIRKRCAIVTDLDAAFFDASPVAEDNESLARYKVRVIRSEKSGAERKARLEEFAEKNPWVSPFYANHTFEIDFVEAGNGEVAAAVVDDIYTDTETKNLAKASLSSADSYRYGRRILAMAKSAGKGWFAILLGGRIDHEVKVPGYLLDALHYAHPVISDETWSNIFEYRVRCDKKLCVTDDASRAKFVTKLAAFRAGDLPLDDLKLEFVKTFPDDGAVQILERW